MYEISASDPGVAACTLSHTWSEIRHGSILWRACTECALTECSVPGLDRCYWLPMEAMSRQDFLSLDPLQRLKTSMGIEPDYIAERLNFHLKAHAPRQSQCERLTTERCLQCGNGYCSDHLAGHRGWCKG